MILSTLFFRLQTYFTNASLIFRNNLQVEEEYVPAEPIDDGGGFFLVALVLWFITLFISRRFMLKHVLKVMNKSSELEASGEPEILKAKEVKAKSQPHFIYLNEATDRTTAIELREQYVKNSFILFRKKYLYGVLASLFYIFIPIGFAKLGGTESQTIVNDQLEMIAGLAILYFIYITLVYYFHRKQYRAENARFGIRLEHPAVTLIRKIVNPQWESYFNILIILMLINIGVFGFSGKDFEGNPVEHSNTIWTTIGYVLAALIHLWLIIKIRKENKHFPNLSLLILRVFGDKKQVLLTFGRITNFWKHIGVWFTVVDPSFIARKYRTFTFRTFFTLLFIFIIAFFIGMNLAPHIAPIIKSLAPVGHASDAEIEEFAIIPGILIAWFLYFRYWKFMTSRSYAKNKDDIQKKIDRVMSKPRKTDMTFKNLPMFCYANTWKIAVNEFIKNSKVILMDLRGFSSERKGCEYEIDFLLDTFKINGVIFLVDVASDKDLVQRTITERWEYLRVNSPNLNIDMPTAKIFTSDSQNETEVQSIIDHLLETAHNNTNI